MKKFLAVLSSFFSSLYHIACAVVLVLVPLGIGLYVGNYQYHENDQPSWPEIVKVSVGSAVIVGSIADGIIVWLYGLLMVLVLKPFGRYLKWWVLESPDPTLPPGIR